mmetsp:Transcript_132887/g.187741  ORF Transcript_132887/g.187741 Transcript_132887/m.187741 type:complete len:106 (+) Transcript_132887:231-548(+)
MMDRAVWLDLRQKSTGRLRSLCHACCKINLTSRLLKCHQEFHLVWLRKNAATLARQAKPVHGIAPAEMLSSRANITFPARSDVQRSFNVPTTIANEERIASFVIA